MNMETYQLVRTAKMRAILEAREKRKKVEPVSEAQNEASRLIKAFTSTRGDVKSAIKLLNISRATFYRKVKAFGLDLKALAAPATPTGKPVVEN